VNGHPLAKNWVWIPLVKSCYIISVKILNYPLGNTNHQNFELFAAVVKANGVGVPLSYLLISMTKEAASGSKEKY
jgi:hypothetical protein